jgi:hypothetical protein
MRRRGGQFKIHCDARRIGRVRRKLNSQLAELAEPLLGGRAFARPDAVRRRQAPRRIRLCYRRLRRRGRSIWENTLAAFQQVEDNLAALRVLETEERQQRDAVASARESLQIFINRYQGGVDNYLQVITAQTITLTNERNEIDIQRRRMDASVLLVKALGGGWNISNLPSLPSLRKC